MKHSFIFHSIDWIFDRLKWLSLVEYFKLIAISVFGKSSSKQRKALIERNATDLFIILKWLFVIIIWVTKTVDPIYVFIVWYLIITNIYTYFYYHTWCFDVLSARNFDINRIRRRYLNLLLAIGFSTISFAYLYQQPYASEFIWADGETSILSSIWYSIANSLTANYSNVIPASEFGSSVSIIQLIITFIFLTIVLANSVPQIGKEVRKK